VLDSSATRAHSLYCIPLHSSFVAAHIHEHTHASTHTHTHTQTHKGNAHKLAHTLNSMPLDSRLAAAAAASGSRAAFSLSIFSAISATLMPASASASLPSRLLSCLVSPACRALMSLVSEASPACCVSRLLRRATRSARCCSVSPLSIDNSACTCSKPAMRSASSACWRASACAATAGSWAWCRFTRVHKLVHVFGLHGHAHCLCALVSFQVHAPF